jgi:hypothetical protein
MSRNLPSAEIGPAQFTTFFFSRGAVMAEGMNILDQDYAQLSRALVEFAQQLLEKQGEFYPFAAIMDKDGKVGLVGADIGVEQPKSTDLLAFLSGALRAKAREGGIGTEQTTHILGGQEPGSRYLSVRRSVPCRKSRMVRAEI